MVKITPIFLTLSCVAAWPQVMEMNRQLQLQKRVEPAERAPTYTQTRPNTAGPPSGFNAKLQYVDTTDGGPNPWKAPGSKDLRGQCPGLNAAANHGFLPRNGITTIAQTVTGLGSLYNMSPELALGLAVIAVAISGDLVAETWSIGGAYTGTVPILPARGIVGTHNKYEGDASIVRGDAYLNGGNVGVFQMRSWEKLYARAEEFTFNEIAAQSDYVTRYGIANNPYFFSAPFSGLVAPAAHDFVIGFMSNHSAEVPGGTLTREVLKSFFSVTGDSPGSFVHTPGHERVPLNWYKRPDAMMVQQVFTDLLANNAQYPGILRFGGNTGTVNSFAGVDLQSLTNGVFNLETLGEGNNGACFLLQASLAGLPDALEPVLGAVGSVLGWATKKLGPLQQALGCPQLVKFNNALFNQFPGASYTG